MTNHSRKDIEFVGLDLGHGETALARAFAQGHAEPEILEYRGTRSVVTAVSKEGKGKPTIRIGAEALTLSDAKIWAKFKSSDLDAPDVRVPLTLFTKALIQGLSDDGSLRGPKDSHFVIGCPSGWSPDVRTHYRNLFVKAAGLSRAQIVSESRAALMTALEQGYLSMDDARASVLIVDIGSSTSDFTFCRNLETDDVGHNILGSGLLDTEIFELNLARQPQRDRIDALLTSHPSYRPILEYWCREAKEAYFTGEDKPVEMIRRLPITNESGARLLFEIRIDKTDADAILSKPLDALQGYSWRKAFDFALRETVDRLGGRDPDTVLLTGGASRLPLVLPATKAAFPSARVIRGAEPEFAIARGLAWLGRFEFLHESFKSKVVALMEPDGDVAQRAHSAARTLGETLAPALVDGLTEDCIKPAFREWRAGHIASLDQVEAALTKSVADWLRSDTAQAKLKPVIGRWFAGLQREIETITDPLCREHGLPAMVLSLDDSSHVSQHLEGLSLTAPSIGHLETDSALLGTTLAAILVSALLAHANLFAPLLMNPLGLLIGGAVAGGSYFYGKKALSGRFRSAKVPVVARQVLTEKRIDQAINKQRPDLIEGVRAAWDGQAAERFGEDLTKMLSRALLDRADERAVLFLI
ncbi:MAG: Hsp70 family protein [Litorimonas sp.]